MSRWSFVFLSTSKTDFCLKVYSATKAKTALPFFHSSRASFSMEMETPVRTANRWRLPLVSVARVKWRQGVRVQSATWEMPIRPQEIEVVPGQGQVVEKTTAKALMSMQIVQLSRLQGEISVDSNIGPVFEGSVIESGQGGEVKATLITTYAPVFPGAPVTISVESSIGKFTIFEGVAVRVTGDIASSTCTITAADPLTAATRDNQVEVSSSPDIVSAFQQILDSRGLRFIDTSEETWFPSVNTGNHVDLDTLIDIVESLRGGQLVYQPDTGEYVLSDMPREWFFNLDKVFSFSESVDPGQYYNSVTVTQDDNWEAPAKREKTNLASAFGKEMSIDKTGEQVHEILLKEGDKVVAAQRNKYSENFLISKEVQSGTATTSTTYSLKSTEDGVPYISREQSISVDSEQEETPFSERVTKTTKPEVSNGIIWVECKTTREWYEKEQAIEEGVEDEL